MNGRIKRHDLATWLGESGEIAVSLGAGASIRSDVHDSAVPLDLIWGRRNRPCLELFSTISGTLEPSTLERTARRILDINRGAIAGGAWLNMAGGRGVSARAIVFLVDDEAAESEVDAAVDALRDTISTYEAEFQEPIDAAHQHRRRCVRSPIETSALAIEQELREHPPSPHSITTRVERGRLFLSSTQLPPLSDRAAARAAGVSVASAIHRTEEGQLVLTSSTPIFDDSERSRRLATTAWQGMAFDLDWLPTVSFDE